MAAMVAAPLEPFSHRSGWVSIAILIPCFAATSPAARRRAYTTSRGFSPAVALAAALLLGGALSAWIIDAYGYVPNAVQSARALLAIDSDPQLQALARASVDDLRKVKGIGRDKAVTLLAAFTLAHKMAEELQRESPVLDNPPAIVALVKGQNLVRDVETLQVLLLNTRRRLIRVAEDISNGTIDTLLVHPREVFKAAIAANAAAVVLVHNHPSGDPTPSDADRRLTQRLRSAAELLSIQLVDHVILGNADLARAIRIPMRVEFIVVTSYGVGKKSSGKVKLISDLTEPIAGKDVLLVEDIIDTGLTMRFLLDNLRARHPASLRTCVLLSKPDRRKVQVHIDYLGFEIPDAYVYGYGLDRAHFDRNMPFISSIKT